MLDIVGRAKELKKLGEAMVSVLKGSGRTILIFGEAGIGKTKLVDEFLENARASGFFVQRGWCLPNSQTPYMPFIEVLRNGGIDHLLIASAPPKIESAFLVTNSGIMISKIERSKTFSDSDIFTGMLTAVTQFIDDCIHQSGKIIDGNVLRMGHGSFNISTIIGKNATIMAVYTGKENEFLLDDMSSVLERIELEFGERIKNWKGVKEDLSGTEPHLQSLFSSEKYDGIDWSRNDPKTLHNNVIDNVTRGLMRVSRQKPRVIFIDDLQWADSSTLALMHYLSRNIKSSRILLIGTYRPEDISQVLDGKEHILVDTMQLMSRESLFDKIELKHLTKEETDSLVMSIISKPKDKNEVTDLVWRESQGNPLFALEMMTLLKEEGVLAEKDGVWGLSRNISDIDIPSRIQDLITRRLSRLLEEQKQILEPASVIGEMFTVRVLEKVTDIKRIQLLKMLDEIEKVHKLIELVDRKYKFSNLKVREVLYNGISNELKIEYHRIVGNVLSELYKDEPGSAVDIGYHYYKARDSEKALPIIKTAIENLMKSYSNNEAAKYCQYALELMEGDQAHPDRGWVQENYAKNSDTLGNYDDALSIYQELISSGHDNKEIITHYADMANILGKKGEFDKALSAINSGKEFVDDEKSPEMAKLLAGEGVVYELKGEYSKAMECQKKALELFSKHNISKDIARTYNRIGVCHWFKGEYEKALQNYEKAIELIEKLDDLRVLAGCFNNLGLVYHFKGNYDKALDCFEKSLKLAYKIGNQLALASTSANIGLVYDSTGNYEKALEYHEKGLALSEKIGDQIGIAMEQGNIGTIYHTKGMFRKALEYHEKNLALSEKIGDQRSMAMALGNIGTALFELGDLNKALDMMEKSLKLSTEIGNQHGVAYTNISLFYLYMKLGQYEDAKKSARIAYDTSLQVGLKELEVISLKLNGMLYAIQKDWANATEMFESSISKCILAGMKHDLGESLIEYGKMLKAKGDAQGADQKFDNAHGIFTELQLPHMIAKVNNERATVTSS